MRRVIPEPVLVDVLCQRQPGAQSVAEEQQLIDEYLTAKALAATTVLAYRKDLLCFVKWLRSVDRSWNTVSSSDLVQFKAWLMGGSGSRALSAASGRRKLGSVKNWYGWLIKTGRASFDPTLSLDLPKLVGPEARNLLDLEVEKILDAAQKGASPERTVALVWVLLHGLRASEAISLNLEDFDGYRLKIRVAKAGSTGTVPLTPHAREILSVYLEQRSQMADCEPQAPLFISVARRNFGKRLTYDGVRKIVDKLSVESGVNFTSHQFRHTFATNLVLSGVDPFHVKTLTRHKSDSSFRRYILAGEAAAAEKAFLNTLS